MFLVRGIESRSCCSSSRLRPARLLRGQSLRRLNRYWSRCFGTGGCRKSVKRQSRWGGAWDIYTTEQDIAYPGRNPDGRSLDEYMAVVLGSDTKEDGP